MLNDEEFNVLKNNTIEEIFPQYFGKLNYDNGVLQQLCETTQPLIGDCKLDTGVFYLVVDSDVDADGDPLIPLIWHNTTAYIIMLAWDRSERSPESVLIMDYANIILFDYKFDPSADFEYPPFFRRMKSRASKESDDTNASTILTWFGMGGGGIYQFTSAPQGPLTLNYSRKGFAVEGLN